MKPKEKKMIELGTQLSKSLSVAADSLVECNGLDSTLIESAQSLIDRLRENNLQHNKFVDQEDLK
jgi:hypothetical protein